MTSPPPQFENTSGTSLSQRFGYYFIGIAIGLVLLGFFMSNRQRAVRSQQAGQQVREQADPVSTPIDHGSESAASSDVP